MQGQLIAVSLFLIVIVSPALGQGIDNWVKPYLRQESEHVFQTLIGIDTCLIDFQKSRSDQGPFFSNPSIKNLKIGLLIGWPNYYAGAIDGAGPAPAPPAPPKEYQKSLDRDLDVCQAALHNKSGKEQWRFIEAVWQDLEIKDWDCHRAGMGRLIRVSVRTVQHGEVVNGWEVFYRFETTSVLNTEELRFPNLTSPAEAELPPGVYLLYARNFLRGKEIKTRPIVLRMFGRGSFPCDLQIP